MKTKLEKLKEEYQEKIEMMDGRINDSEKQKRILRQNGDVLDNILDQLMHQRALRQTYFQFIKDLEDL